MGATLIITCSTLFRPFRELFQGSDRRLFQRLYELLVCPMCTGFWVGWAASLLGLTLVGDGWSLLLQAFADACAASWACWASHVVLCHLGQGRLLSSRPDLVAGER